MQDEDFQTEESAYPSGIDDEDVKRALLLIGQTNSDKTTRDQQNRLINDILREGTIAQEPTAPRYIGAKRLKQAKTKTAERIQPLKWWLQGDGADEDMEIIVTQAVKEVLHRGGYDATFTGKNGIIDGILSYGDKARFVIPADKKKTGFPVRFMIVDSNNLWFTKNATSFRHGNKNVTHIVALFHGTKGEFFDVFPEYKGKNITMGIIPKSYTTFKDLDQTTTQQFQGAFSESNDDTPVEWMYVFDIRRKVYMLVVGERLQVLLKQSGDEYPWVFENSEGKEEVFFPIVNYICLPAEEGAYNVGLCAYLFDLCITFRRSINQLIAHANQTIFPHTYINIPKGQEASFFNLVEMANQMSAAGQTPYIPLSYDPATGAPNQISPASPLVNNGNPSVGENLMARIDDEFRKCGVYLDEPINSSVTATQIEYNASNALTLPKAIMKYNAPEIEFEVMVAIDMIKKYVKKGDKTPLVLDTNVDLPDGSYSIRGISLTLGWLKDQLTQRAWKVRTDPESGASMNNSALLSLYEKILPLTQTGSPEYNAITQKIALLTGVIIPKQNPATQMMAANAGRQQYKEMTGEEVIPTGGQKVSIPSPNEAAGIPM
nr:MAG: hypothetical protein [Podoviridae sp. ctka020]